MHREPTLLSGRTRRRTGSRGACPLTEPPLPSRRSDGRWNLDALRAWQQQLSAQVEPRDRFRTPRRVAGCDVSYDRGSDLVVAAVVVMDADTREVLDESVVYERVVFPYLPGYLSFRESPPVLHAVRRLGLRPDLLLVDAHGRAHPRRFGLACHLGLALDLPAIGVAKSRLVGTYREPPPQRGASTPLLDGDDVVGAVVRTRARVRPVFVSVGHRVGLDSAVRIVLEWAPTYRSPEPLRLAHRRVNEARAKLGVDRGRS